VNFIDKKGKKIETMGKVGDSVLAVAHEHNIELEGS
jgi:ferredoxin